MVGTKTTSPDCRMTLLKRFLVSLPKAAAMLSEISFGLSVGLAVQARRSRHGAQEPRVPSQLKENSLYVSLESRRPGDKAQKLP